MQSKENSGNVTVVCRFRPFNNREKEMGVSQAVEFNPDGKRCKILLPQVSFATPILHITC